MKNLSRVVWSEGMYLGLHHFQAQARYFEDSVQFATASLRFQPYGFTQVNFDAEALANGTLSLLSARGLFPDGLPFDMPVCDALPAPRRIADVMPPTRDAVDVYLSVPERMPDGLNCDLSGDGRNCRFISAEHLLADENTGREEKPIRLGRKNIGLLLEHEAGRGVALPAARIRRSRQGQLILDDRFIPPCIELAGSPALLRLGTQLVGLLAAKCSAIAKPKDLGNPTASGFSAEGISNAWFLHCLNSSLGPLRHLSLTKRAHPEELYGELLRLAGALCTFSLESHPSQLPLYHHESLTDCFETIDQHIRSHLELLVPTNRVSIPLVKIAPYFYVGEITDQRVLNRSRWVFGVHSRIGEAEVIERTPRLVKICSREFIPKLVERALPGMQLAHLSVPPPAVSPKVEYQYFSIDRAGPCWDHLAKTRQVGVYIPGELPDPDIELSVVLDA